MPASPARPSRRHARAATIALAVMCLHLMGIGIGTAAGHDGHQHGQLAYGPPAPDWHSPDAARARVAFQQATFQRQLAEAPAEVDGACRATDTFDGIGPACRSEAGLLRIELPDGTSVLSHGPDFAASPGDIAAARTSPGVAAAVRSASRADVACVTDLSTPHTRLVYAIPADGVDRSAQQAPLLRQSAYEASAVLDNASLRWSATAGRRLRVACDGDGDATVSVVRLARRADAVDFAGLQAGVAAALGHGRVTNARYLVFYDDHMMGAAGLGTLSEDDTAAASNPNNLGGRMAMQDNSGETGPSWSTLLHELSHNMGAVQDAAPGSNAVSHCNDGRDVMCYAEPTTAGVQGSYAETACVELEYDCGGDTYYNPVPSGWLATHWNAASTSNQFLDAYQAVADTTAPATPTGLAATGRGRVAELTWDAVADADVHAYRVERLDGVTWVTVDDVAAPATGGEVTWPTLLENTTGHQLRVRAYDDRGNASAASSPVTFDAGSTWVVGDYPATQATPPPPPTNVVVLDATASTITLGWSGNRANAYTYVVEKPYQPGTWFRADETGQRTIVIDTDTFGDPLAANTRYDFRVLAKDESGVVSVPVAVSGWTDVAPDTVAPAAPASIQATSVSGDLSTAAVAWDAVPDAASYLVSVETSPGTYEPRAYVTATSVELGGLVHGTSTIAVQARDATGNASPRVQTSYTSPAARDSTPPTAATLTTTFTSSYTTLTVNWTPGSDASGIAEQRVLLTDGTPGSVETVAAVLPAAATTATIAGLLPNRSYYAFVETVDGVGLTSVSNGYGFPMSHDGSSPTSPAPLVAAGATATSIDLSWASASDGGSGIAGYRVHRTAPGGAELLTTTTSTSFTATGLDPDTSYSFSVEAVDRAGNVGTAAVATHATLPLPDPVPPSAPTSVTVDDVAETTVTLAWSGATDDVGVTGYRIVAAPGSEVLATVGNVQVATVSGLDPFTEYGFAVEARDAAGNWSGASSAVVVRTTDVTPPGAVGNLVASATTANSTTLTWTAATDNAGIVSYRVEQVAPAGGTLATTTDLEVDIGSLAEATQYSFRVVAVDVAGNEAAATVEVSTLDATAPSMSGTVTASGQHAAGATLAWGAATDAVGVTGYRVHLDDANGDVLATTAGTSVDVTGLDDGVTYTLAVVAVDGAGNASAARTVTFATLDETAPSAPGGLTATPRADGSTVDLAWSAATDNTSGAGAISYRVHLDGVALALGTTAAGATSYAATGLDDATPVTFRVEAIDAAGNTSPMAVATTTTPDVSAPTTPTGLVATGATMTSIAIEWTASTDNAGPVSYVVAVDGVAVPDAAVGTTATLVDLAASTSYAITVTAADGAGLQSAAATLTATTSAVPDAAPSAPGMPVASDVTTTSMALAWAASSDDLPGVTYQVERWNGTTWTALLGAPTTSTTATLTGLAPATSYALRIVALDAAGNSSASPRLDAATLTPADTTAPSAPAGPGTATAGPDGTVGLTWGAATDDRGTIDRYRVRRADTAITVATTSGRSTTLTGQPIGRTVTYEVLALDPAGNVSAPLAIVVAIPAPPPVVAAPEPVGGLSVTPATSSVLLSWQQPGGPVASYRIVERRGGVVASIRETTGTSSRFGPYLPKTAVRFEVTTLANGLESGAVTIDARTLPDVARPTRPTRLRGVARPRGTVVLSWRPARDDVRVARYEVRYAAPRVRARTVRVAARTPRLTLRRLRARTTYRIQVRAVDTSGNASAWIALRVRAR